MAILFYSKIQGKTKRSIAPYLLAGNKKLHQKKKKDDTALPLAPAFPQGIKFLQKKKEDDAPLP